MEADARVSCSVLGCRRTRDPAASPFPEYLCPAHWVMVPRRLRRLRGLIVRRGNALGWPPKLLAQQARTWRSAVRLATECALGI